jgi:hypothetical protein
VLFVSFVVIFLRSIRGCRAERRTDLSDAFAVRGCDGDAGA